ncbi:MAG: HupE/UreJ family protein [Polaromonas sp.]|nr:HupE/UreJ family protein [Polaromonas sp.]
MKRWLLLFLLVFQGAAWAHKPSDSYLTLRATKGSNSITVRWDIALRDLDYVLQLDRDGNGDLSWGEVRQRADDITRLATSRLALTAAGKPCALSATAPMQLDKHSDGTYAVLSLSAQCPVVASPLKASYSMLFDVDPSHRGLLQWIAPVAKGSPEAAQALIFSTESAEQTLALQPPSPWQTFSQYVVEGVWHIWIGYDHILFLLALLLPAVVTRQAGQWVPVVGFVSAAKEVVKVVTAFTLAHSITLSLAGLQIISLPSRLVESVIAASVIVAALNNLRGTVEGKRWLMAFGFGLIHGFGFASVLADLGLPKGALVLALVGFNVGVELGQLAIVAVFLPLAFWLRATRFYRVGLLMAGSIVVALLASWWLAQRLFDL